MFIGDYMVLEFDKLNSFYIEKEELMKQMRNEVDEWLDVNGLLDYFRIPKLSRMNIVLESVDVGLDEKLLRDFEVVFGVACESVWECRVKDFGTGETLVKYSYYFKQSGGIF